jgi:hypothetical protein
MRNEKSISMMLIFLAKLYIVFFVAYEVTVYTEHLKSIICSLLLALFSLEVIEFYTICMRKSKN